MYRYKIDVVTEMSKKGFNSYRMKKDGLMSQGTLKKLANNENVTLDTLNTVCCILRCDIGDIIEIIPTNEEKIKYF